MRRIDISEEVYAKVVTMRDPDTDLINLIVATMNGNVLQFSTGGKWVNGSGERNDGGNMDGIYVPHYLSMVLDTDRLVCTLLLPRSHSWFDVVGNRVDLPITIVDRRKNTFGRKYHVAVFRKGRVLVEEVALTGDGNCRISWIPERRFCDSRMTRWGTTRCKWC